MRNSPALLFGLTLALASLLLPTTTQAEVKLAGMFSDHMVLQRELAISIWGTAAADEEVTVKSPVKLLVGFAHTGAAL